MNRRFFLSTLAGSALTLPLLALAPSEPELTPVHRLTPSGAWERVRMSELRVGDWMRMGSTEGEVTGEPTIEGGSWSVTVRIDPNL